MPYPGELYNVNFESPAVLAEFLAALHDPGKRFLPVKPARSTHGDQRAASATQAMLPERIAKK